MKSRDWLVAIAAGMAFAMFSPVQERMFAQSGSGIVISEFRLRGPSGVSDEFVEIFNAGNVPINLTSWQLLGSNNNAPAIVANRVTITAPTIINPGCYFLFANNNTGGYSGNVTPDLTYRTGVADDGGVAIALPAPASTIVDAVGYGNNALGEGRRLGTAPTTNINRGVERRPGGTQGHVDTNDNFTDFKEITANPQNAKPANCLPQGAIAITASLSPASVEQGQALTVFGTVAPGTVPASSGIQVVGNLSSVGGSASAVLLDDGVAPDAVANDKIFTTSVAVPAANPLGARAITLTVTDAQGRTATHTVNANVVAPAIIYRPHEVQGPGAVTPFPLGTSLTVKGVVTARAVNGFFIQTEPGMEDSDAATSEGLFVLTGGVAPAAAQVGRLVNVTGQVAEFVPPADPLSAPVTELVSVIAVTDVGSSSLPDAVALTASVVSDAGSLDQLERFEGMLVSASSLTAVSGTGGLKDETNAVSTSDGAFFAVLTGQPRPFREPGVEAGHPVLPCAVGPCDVPLFDGNPERLRVDSDALEGLSPVNVTTGTVVDNVAGPLDFASRTYTILANAPLVSSGGMAIVNAPAAMDQFTVASFNLERFYDATNNPGSDAVLTAAAYDLRVSKASQTIRNVLNMPDIIGVQDVENLGALFAIAQRVDTDAAAAGQTSPQYAPFLFEGNDSELMNVGFLVKQVGHRVALWSVDQVGRNETFTDPTDNSELLLNDRPPVVLRATAFGPSTTLPQKVTVIVNHLRSLSDVDATSATGARVRAQRQAQANFLANYIQGLQINDPNEAIVSIGDYNAYSFNDGYVDTVGTVRGLPASPDHVAVEAADVVSPDLADADDFVAADERYSSLSGGNAEALDHVLFTANLLPQFAGVVRARVNADFPEVLRGDATTPARLSDHDPLVAYFTFPPDVTAPVFSFTPDDRVVEAAGPDGAVVDYEAPAASDNLDVSVDVTCEPASGNTFPIGNTGVTCSTQDLAGNGASVSFTVTVQDTTSPTVATSADLVVEAESGAGTAVAFDATATDLVTPSLTPVCAPASGSTFALGATTVTCMASDAAGNVGTASFTVTVRDTTAPVFSTLPNLVDEATSPLGRAVSFDANATDTVTASVAVACSPASGSVFPLGTTTVQCSAHDAAGNPAAASFTVTIRDTTAPALSVPQPITEEATSPSGKSVSFVATAADAVTLSPLVSCTPASGSTFPIGETLVSCVATDAAGNSSTQSFTVAVTVPVFGHMGGAGTLMTGTKRTWFTFDALESADFTKRGTLVVQVRDMPGRPDRYLSANVVDLRFTDASNVAFTATGTWNGVGGYRVEVTARDRGEPGRDRDTFSVTIYSPSGVVVETASGVLRDGNIQSRR